MRSTNHKGGILNLAFFIAKRIGGRKSTGFSRLIIRLATVATALSVAVMILSVAIVSGYKKTLEEKMFVFWGQIEIAPYNPNPSSVISPQPFSYDPQLIKRLKELPQIEQAMPFALKPGIIRSKAGNMEGIRLKGVGPDYSLTSEAALNFKGKGLQFNDSLYSKDLVLSTTTLNRLEAKVGDTVLAFFMDPANTFPQIRKLHISGSYHTGMANIDQAFAFCDLALIQQLSQWAATDINGYQIHIKNYKEAETLSDAIYQNYLTPPLYPTTMQEMYPNIYGWLGLMDRNAYIILAIMAIVSVINLSTALLIFILERTNMTGILKSLGMPNRSLQTIFLYHSLRIAVKGVLWGTVIGVTLSLLQQKFKLIHLDESSYYLKDVPIHLSPFQILAIDGGTLLFCLLILWIPILFVRRISPLKAIRFR